MGKKAGNKGAGGKKAATPKLKPVGKLKDKLKAALGEKEYKALKKQCCDPKHPHCGGCPLLKALAKLLAVPAVLLKLDSISV